MDQDKVSVLLAIPTDQVEAMSTRETVQSVASQSYPTSLIETLQVQYMPQTPGGRTAALNAARDQAKGEFQIHTEAGVTWDPSKIERQVLRIREGGEDAGVGSAHRMSVRNASGKIKQTDFSLIATLGLRLSTLLAPPWKASALLIQSDVMHGVGAYRHIDQQVWEHDIRLAERHIKIELLEEDLAIWNVDSDPDGNLQRDLFPSRVRQTFLKQHLDRVNPETLIFGSAASSENQILLHAALHLFNDDLDASHSICQSFDRECAAASFWHGLIHRRELDFRNAKGSVGRSDKWEGLLQIRDGVQDVLERILLTPEYGTARDTAFALKRHLDEEGVWDSAHFIDLVEANLERESIDEMEGLLLTEIQEAEMLSALDWTHRCAIGD